VLSAYGVKSKMRSCFVLVTGTEAENVELLDLSPLTPGGREAENSSLFIASFFSRKRSRM